MAQSKAVQWWPEDIKERVDRIAQKYEATFVKKEDASGLTEKEKETLAKEYIEAGAGEDGTPMEEPFFMVDISMVEEQMRQWIACLPRVRPYYAFKCNGSPVLLETIAALGGGFDCASAAEFDYVLNMKQHLDPEDDIIFANPCKQVSHIKAANAHGLKYVTFDNEAELPKIKKHWPDAKVVLRIVTDDSKSICEFSSKYGAQLSYVPKLIDTCLQLDLDLVGVSFHVGSGCGDAGAFVEAATDARRVFDMAASRGVTMNFLDIGGGFPGDKKTTPSFPQIAERLSPVLDELFDESVRIIAEPGRYFACASHTLAANVFAKRDIEFTEPSSDDNDTPETTTETQYYLNEGVYQSFNCLFFDHAIVDAHPLFVAGQPNKADKCTTIFGPTCDGLDCIAKRIPFPEMELGDWMVFHDFGAYTIAAASKFNGFETKRVSYIRSM